jgi:hypothetical protein
MKDSVKVKGTLLMVVEKVVLDGEPEVARCTAAFLNHMLKISRDGVADPLKDDTVHPNPPWIIGRSIIYDVLDQGIAL